MPANRAATIRRVATTVAAAVAASARPATSVRIRGPRTTTTATPIARPRVRRKIVIVGYRPASMITASQLTMRSSAPIAPAGNAVQAWCVPQEAA